MREHWHWGLVLLAVGSMLWLWQSELRSLPSKATDASPPRALSVTQGSVSNETELSDPLGRFRLRAPQGWTPAWHGGEGSLALSLKGPSEGAEQPVLELRVSQAPPVSADELYVQAIRMASSRRERVVDGGRSENDGNPIVELTVDDESGSLRSYLRFISDRGWLLQVRGTSSVASFKKHLPTFQQMASSTRGR